MSIDTFIVGIWSKDRTNANIGICIAIVVAFTVAFLWEKFRTNDEKKQDAVGKKESTVAQAGSGEDPSLLPQSVNYHFTRQCNYSCGFCFHTAKTSFVLPIEDAKKGLRMLKEAGKYHEDWWLGLKMETEVGVVRGNSFFMSRKFLSLI